MRNRLKEALLLFSIHLLQRTVLAQKSSKMFKKAKFTAVIFLILKQSLQTTEKGKTEIEMLLKNSNVWITHSTICTICVCLEIACNINLRK